MEHQSITTKVDPDLRRLLHAMETLKKPEDTMDQEQWSDFCRRWQGALKANACNSDPQLAVLLAHLPALRTLKLRTEAKSCSGFTLPLLHRLAGRKDLSGSRPILGSLSLLYVEGLEIYDSSPRLAVELLTIPTLSDFYGTRHALEEAEQIYHVKNRPFQSLVYLQLMTYCYEQRALYTTLKQCTSLESFAF